MDDIVDLVEELVDILSAAAGKNGIEDVLGLSKTGEGTRCSSERFHYLIIARLFINDYAHLI